MMNSARADPVIVQIADGVYAQREEKQVGLPRRLEPLLAGMTVVGRSSVRIVGTRLACRDDHDYRYWLSGLYRTMQLRLSLCIFCGTVEVRDVSLDILMDEAPGQTLYLTPRSRARRKNERIGSYSGRRPAGRTYS